ncbi:hypothetical protein TNCV_5114021 [Trichonephila clavipes]|nr:hypothetical protein TNCV_5114021 [Trichonephila clavipes]
MVDCGIHNSGTVLLDQLTGTPKKSLPNISLPLVYQEVNSCYLQILFVHFQFRKTFCVYFIMLLASDVFVLQIVRSILGTVIKNLYLAYQRKSSVTSYGNATFPFVGSVQRVLRLFNQYRALSTLLAVISVRAGLPVIRGGNHTHNNCAMDWSPVILKPHMLADMRWNTAPQNSIVQPIAAMPLSRQKKPTFAKPYIKVLSRHGIEDCSTVRMPKRKRLFNRFK